MSTRKRTDLKPYLAIAAIVGIVVLTLALVFVPSELPGSVKDILLLLVGALITIVKDVYSYYFGSSEGSARKTELLAPTPAAEENTNAGA